MSRFSLLGKRTVKGGVRGGEGHSGHPGGSEAGRKVTGRWPPEWEPERHRGETSRARGAARGEGEGHDGGGEPLKGGRPPRETQQSPVLEPSGRGSAVEKGMKAGALGVRGESVSLPSCRADPGCVGVPFPEDGDSKLKVPGFQLQFGLPGYQPHPEAAR